VSKTSRHFLAIMAVLLPLAGAAGVWWFSSAWLGLTADESQLLAHSRAAQVAAPAATAQAWLPAGMLFPRVLAWCEPHASRCLLARGVGTLLMLLALYVLLWLVARPARPVVLLLGISAVWLQAGAQVTLAPASVLGITLALAAFRWLWPSPSLVAGGVYLAGVVLALLLAPAAALLVAVQGAWLVLAGLRRLRARVTAGQGMAYSALGVVALCAGLAVLYPDLHYVAALSAPPLLAGLQRVWSVIGALSGSRGVPQTVVQQGIAAGVAVLILIAGARGIWHGCAGSGLAGVYLLVYLGAQGLLCTTARGRDILRDTWQLLPVLVILVAGGVSGFAAWINRGLGRVRVRRLRHVLQALCWAVLGVGLVLWLTVQARTLLWVCSGVADQDVTAPTLFLRQAMQPEDLLVVQVPGDVRVLPQMRYSVAPFLAGRPANRVIDIPPAAAAALAAVAQAGTPGWWLVGAMDTSALALVEQAGGGTNITVPFAVPVTYFSGSNAWSAHDAVRILRQAVAAAPLSRAVYSALLRWYQNSPAVALQAALVSGTAVEDLAPRLVSRCAPSEYRAALNRVLYAWGAPENIRATQGAYSLFHGYVAGVDAARLDRERVGYIYRLYLEQALAQSNSVAARAILRDARRWDADDPYYDRLEAGIVKVEQPAAHDRMRRLNTRAARRYARRTGRQFADALFANALLARAAGNNPRALQECHAILGGLQTEEQAPAPATNASPAVLQAHEQRRVDRLFWEAQCNSYIALLMMATGDYRNAIGWQSKNLDQRFDVVWHRVSYERLATMYLALGDVTLALRKYEEMATVATTAYERLYWMLQGAQINVTYGDAIAVFDQWAGIERGLAQLSDDDRQRWSRDKQLQRVLRYVQRRLNVDVRDAAETAFLRRVQETPRDADWLYQQIAQLQRCRLQYERAAATFALALALTQTHYAVYLDAAMLAYQRQQYARAVILVSNMFLHSTQPCDSALSSDWRYVALALLRDAGKPAGMPDVLQRVDRARAAYATPAHWHNARGNVYALYNNFAAATNEFAMGLAANPDHVDNYLDLGYLFCARADAEETGLLLDCLAARYPSNALPRRVMQDWRAIELYHVSIRPYVVE